MSVLFACIQFANETLFYNRPMDCSPFVEIARCRHPEGNNSTQSMSVAGIKTLERRRIDFDSENNQTQGLYTDLHICSSV